MGLTADRKFDWIAALSIAAGAAVIVPSIAAVVATLFAVLSALF